jgi:acyl carrier protein
MDKLHQIVSKGLLIPPDKVTEDLKYNFIPEWDSVAHMALIAEIEESFDIMMDTDDIVEMSSVGKIREILQKYDVDV